VLKNFSRLEEVQIVGHGYMNLIGLNDLAHIRFSLYECAIHDKMPNVTSIYNISNVTSIGEIANILSYSNLFLKIYDIPRGIENLDFSNVEELEIPLRNNVRPEFINLFVDLEELTLMTTADNSPLSEINSIHLEKLKRLCIN
jgi:hypothetical protein